MKAGQVVEDYLGNRMVVAATELHNGLIRRVMCVRMEGGAAGALLLDHVVVRYGEVIPVEPWLEFASVDGKSVWVYEAEVSDVYRLQVDDVVETVDGDTGVVVSGRMEDDEVTVSLLGVVQDVTVYYRSLRLAMMGWRSKDMQMVLSVARVAIGRWASSDGAFGEGEDVGPWEGSKEGLWKEVLMDAVGRNVITAFFVMTIGGVVALIAEVGRFGMTEKLVFLGLIVATLAFDRMVGKSTRP